MSSNSKGFIFIVVLIVVIVGGIIFMNNKKKATADNQTGSSDPNTAPVTDSLSLNPDNKDQAYIDNLLKDMSAQGMTMYGASWCPHCQAQKAAFGSAISDLKYVECSADSSKPQADVCNNVTYVDATDGKTYNGVQGYPTWIYQGKGYSGEKTITDLAKIVGFTDNTSGSATTSSSAAAPSTTP